MRTGGTKNYYAKSPADDPAGPDSGFYFRVLRGGSWEVPPAPDYFRSAFRDHSDSYHPRRDRGFRVPGLLPLRPLPRYPLSPVERSDRAS